MSKFRNASGKRMPVSGAGKLKLTPDRTSLSSRSLATAEPKPIAKAGSLWTCQTLSALSTGFFMFVVSYGLAFAQDKGASAPYCAELKELNNYAMTRQRFAPIIGKPRVGNYSETTLPLTGWDNCAFYGTTTYTCDSTAMSSREEAAKAQQRISKEILACFAGTWAEAPEQAGPDFLVLHPKLGLASITLNLDETDTAGFVVRLILFLRR